MLFYLQTVIQPSVDDATESINAVNRLGQAKLASMKLVNAINEVTALSGESSKTIWLFLDDHTSIECIPGDNIIKYRAEVETDMSKNFNNCYPAPMDALPYCDGNIQVIDDAALDCSNFHVKEGNETPKIQVRIYKLGGTTYVQDVWT